MFLHFNIVKIVALDRLVLHDQPVPGGNCHAVLRDQEARNGADAAGTGALPVDVDAGQHVGQRVGVVLPSNHQIHCPPVAEEQAAHLEAIPGLSQSQEAAQIAEATKSAIATVDVAQQTQQTGSPEEAQEETASAMP